MDYVKRQIQKLGREMDNSPHTTWLREGRQVDKTIRVLIADDHPLIRTALRGTLAPAPDIKVTGEASDGSETLQTCLQLTPDVLLLDLSMPGPSAIDIVAHLKNTLPSVRILVLTAFDDDAYVRPLMNAGIHGYLLKDEAPDVIIQAIRTVSRGLHWYSPVVLADLSRQDMGVPPKHLLGLNPNDQMLLWAVVAGWSREEIATMLGMPPSRIRNTVEELCKKLGVGAKNELVRWAHNVGIHSAQA